MSLLNFTCLRNVSQDSVTDIGWMVDHPDDPDFDLRGIGYATSVIVLLIFLTGVPWNVFVICTIVKKKLYSNPTILLLLNLAITNLLLGLLVMPFNIITGFSGEYLFGNTDAVRCGICQTGLTLIILPWVSIHTISLMSVDRFIYLKRPLKYNVLVTPRRMLIAIAIIWTVCTVISLPPLLGFGEIKFSFTVATCVPLLVGRTHVAPNFFYVLFVLAEVLVPIIVLLVMYIWVIYIIRKSLFRRSAKSNHVEAQGEDKRSSKMKNLQLRLVRLFGAILTANLLTWLPMIALALTGAIVGSGRIPTPMYTFAYLSFLSETVIHPILEACLIREVRVILSGYLGFCRRIKWCRGRKGGTSNLRANSANDSTTYNVTNTHEVSTTPVNINSLSEIPLEDSP